MSTNRSKLQIYDSTDEGELTKEDKLKKRRMILNNREVEPPNFGVDSCKRCMSIKYIIVMKLLIIISYVKL